MHIAIATLWFPSKKDPMYGIFILQQAKELALHCDVTVMVASRSLIPQVKRYSIGRVNVIEKNGPYFPRNSEKRLDRWSENYLSMFDEVNQQKKVDLVHCHDYIAVYAGYKIWQKREVPYIVTVHNSRFIEGEIESWRTDYLKKTFSGAKNIISVSPVLNTYVEDFVTGDRTKVLPNFIDTSLFSLGEKRSLPFKFLFVGSFTNNKRVLLMLEAFHQLDRGSKFTFIGFGPKREDLENYVEKNNLNEAVKILGPIQNEELPRYYQSHHCYVSISEIETFGITLLEAMSCGMHIIYNQSGGPQDNVPNFGCYLVEDVNLQSVTEAFQWMIKHYNPTFSSQLREHAVQHFSSEVVIQQLMEIYISISESS